MSGADDAEFTRIQEEKQTRAQEVYEDLIGTARNLSDTLTEAELDDDVLMGLIFDMIDECVVCNWWWDVDDLTECGAGLTCDECRED